jgi:para-nitrobenzyl esterase
LFTKVKYIDRTRTNEDTLQHLVTSHIAGKLLVVHYYSFRQQPPFPVGSVYEGWGASHFAELWYVFDHLDQEPWRWSEADRKVAEEVSSYWVNFAKSDNPNGPDLPPRPVFINADSKVLYIGDPMTVGRVANINSLSVFDAVYTTVPGTAFAAR